MVVQHNVTAMNSNRMLNITSKSQSKSTEKLSSGYKINRAADDAAGLSISEKMRKQIRGLTQASSNAQDGISAVQTAEGALNEVQDMLQRMNELAVKAANGTNSTDDREYIQNEVDQLVSEINRVSETTKFNETYLLKGDKNVTENTIKYGAADTTTAAAHAKALTSTAGSPKMTAAADIAFETVTSAADKKAQNELLAALKKTGISVTSNAAAAATIDSATLSGYDITVGADNKTLSISKSGSATVLAKIAITSTATGTTETLKAGAASTEATFKGDAPQFYDANGNKVSANALDNYINADNSGYKAGKTLYDEAGDAVTFDATKFQSVAKDAGALTLKLHVGADATTNNQISVAIDAMSAKGLGIDGVLVNGADDSKALDAIETIKAAIQKISTQRSALGAVQNRLDHTINNLDNVVENTTSAESAIRDTDMATEMVSYSNNNILAQAGQAMLAQANQSNQGVLSLLR